MPKFKDDKVKEFVKNTLAKDPTTADYNIKSKLFQVSDDVCISFRMPSIYNRVFEAAMLPEKFRSRYEDLMFYIQCIEGIYQIDHVNKKLLRMQTKVEADKIEKTVANKYKAYAAILQNLKPDEYYSIPAFIKEIRVDHTEDITFAIPETTCPKCGKKVEETAMDAMNLLFTRLRLQTIRVL